jgi:quinol monooxygenase YgiN
MTITVINFWTVKTESIHDVRQLLEEIIPTTKTYEGCISQHVFWQEDKPENFVLVGEWISKEKYNNYIQWRKDNNILQKFIAMFEKPPVTEFYKKENF